MGTGEDIQKEKKGIHNVGTFYVQDTNRSTKYVNTE